MHKRLNVTESIGEVSGRIVFGPTKSHAAPRTVPLPPSLQGRLERHLEGVRPEPNALVFTSPAGHPIRYRHFRERVWVKTHERFELPTVGLHALRHSAAAMIGAG